MTLRAPDGLTHGWSRPSEVQWFTSAGRVSVQLSSDADATVIDVVDTGIGISPDEQGGLFERFFRTTAADRNAIQGSGLGLSIARAITNAHGGTIELDSSGSNGTTFRLTLPLDALAKSA